MIDKVERQQILEAMKLIGSEDMDREAFHKAVLEAFDVEFGPTERQRTLGRLLGRKPEDFIP